MITELPSLASLSQLQELDVYGNKISSLASLSGHPKLRHVDASFNRLRSLEGFGDLALLEQLYVVTNKLKEVRRGCKKRIFFLTFLSGALVAWFWCAACAGARG